MAMEEAARRCLMVLLSRLEQTKATYLMDHLVTDGVITTEEEDRVSEQATRQGQAEALVELLLKKDTRAYVSLYNALVKESFGDLAGLLRRGLPDSTPEAKASQSDGDMPQGLVRAVLSAGGVPQRPVVFVSRPALLDQLKKELRQLRDEPGWVCVFGMAGSGKSVLASEVVRDHALLEECFPGGVHWVSVGQVDRAELLVKIQALCFRLGQSQQGQDLHRTRSLEEAKERLRFLTLREHPQPLLILDDVWDSSVLKAFDIQGRVLLTSRDRSLMDAVSGSKFVVAMESGLGEDKALEILSLYVKEKVPRLPEQARNIVTECKGSPLVVSLIGALLREFPDRWAYYLQKLRRKQFQRIRKSSSYDYDALDQAMAASMEVLSEDHRPLYRDLTVLQKDVKVPAKVLSVVWDMEIEEVEDVLQDFVNKSLLFKDCNQKPYLYYLHDLQLDFLSEQNRAQLQELHSKVVRQYQQYYKEAPPTSDQEDLYWFRYLTYHMVQAGLTKELSSLMFSLDWVRTKSKVLGPAHLINDYVEYGPILDKENSEVRCQFQEFLSLNGPRLEQQPFPDVVQLALCQPSSSQVYQQALLQAQQAANRGRLYFDWLNKRRAESLCHLVVQPLQGSVYSACFSHDGSKIASCGSSKSLQVFRSTSGEKLLEIQAHDDDILCCAFSPDDRLLATCSSDRTVKVWNAQNGSLRRMFDKEHEEQINHCHFTNTKQRLLLATCSNDTMMNVKLWNLNKPSCQNTMFGHMEPVNHCCFSPDDRYLSTCSRDGTLKLFNVASANLWKTIDVKNEFPVSDDLTLVNVTCSTWSGQQVVCAARNAVFVFEVETGDLLLDIRTSGHSTVQYCHASPTSTLLAVALSHYTVELWDLQANKKTADLSGHLSWVHGVQFSSDGSQLLSCSEDRTVRLWESNRKSSTVPLKRDFDVTFSQDKVTVVAADNNNTLQVIEALSGQCVMQTKALGSRIRCVCFSSLSSAVAVGLEDGVLQVLAVPGGELLAELSGHTRSVLHCYFSPDGETLFSCSEDTSIRVWRWRTGQCVCLLGHSEQVRRFILLHAHTHTHLLSWSYDGTVKLWDSVSGVKLQDTVCHQGAVLSCDISPDRKLFVTGSADHTAKVWSCDSWMLVHELSKHKDCVRTCRFSWDNSRLATGDDSGEILLWNVRDGCVLKVCSRGNKDAMDSLHGGWISDLHFSLDDSLLLSAGGYMKWWAVESGEALQTFYPTGAALKRVHVSPDFSTFVTIDNIGALYLLQRVSEG